MNAAFPFEVSDMPDDFHSITDQLIEKKRSEQHEDQGRIHFEKGAGHELSDAHGKECEGF